MSADPAGLRSSRPFTDDEGMCSGVKHCRRPGRFIDILQHTCCSLPDPDPGELCLLRCICRNYALRGLPGAFCIHMTHDIRGVSFFKSFGKWIKKRVGSQPGTGVPSDAEGKAGTHHSMSFRRTVLPHPPQTERLAESRAAQAASPGGCISLPGAGLHRPLGLTCGRCRQDLSSGPVLLSCRRTSLFMKSAASLKPRDTGCHNSDAPQQEPPRRGGRHQTVLGGRPSEEPRRGRS